MDGWIKIYFCGVFVNFHDSRCPEYEIHISANHLQKLDYMFSIPSFHDLAHSDKFSEYKDHNKNRTMIGAGMRLLTIRGGGSDGDTSHESMTHTTGRRHLGHALGTSQLSPEPSYRVVAHPMVAQHSPQRRF